MESSPPITNRATDPPAERTGPPSGTGFPSRTSFGAALILLLTLVAYIPVLRGGFIWDDNNTVTENTLLRSWDGLKSLWLDRGAMTQYYPLSHTFLWLQYHVWGVQPGGYHLVNVVLHALSAILLWSVLVHLAIPGAWFAAAIFALHPIEVESVAWITEFRNVVSCTFFIASILFYSRFALPVLPERSKAHRWRLYAVAFALFSGALLCKPVTCSMPAVMLLLIWWKRGRVTWRDVLPLVPFFIIGLVAALNMAWIERYDLGGGGAGAIGDEWDHTFIERSLIAGRALWFYAGKVLWPFGIIFIYPRWEIDAAAWWQYLYPLAAAALVVVLWAMRRFIGRGPLVAALYFGGTLLPGLGFFSVYFTRYSFVQDHFQYISGIALIVLAVSFTSEVFRIALKVQGGNRVRIALPLLLLVFLGTLTWREGLKYRDEKTLWQATLEKNPLATVAHNNLAILLMAEGDNDRAISHLEFVLRERPEYPEGHSNMGMAYAGNADFMDAVPHYQRALELEPLFTAAHVSLGVALEALSRHDEAFDHFQTAARIEPDYTPAHVKIGDAYLRRDRYREAAESYRAALKLEPGLADAHNGLGAALAGQGDYEGAIASFTVALRLNPDHALAKRNLAETLKRTPSPPANPD